MSESLLPFSTTQLKMAAPVLARSSQTGLFQNPFLDPYAVPQGGVASTAGSPLTRLQIPPVETLVYKTGETTGRLSMVNVSEALTRAGLIPQEPVLVRDETVGIELNLNLFGAALQSPSQVTPMGTAPAQTMGRQIPKDMREARNVLHMITPARAGTKNAAFGITELKQIARNLDLPATGNKDFLANSIRTAIIEYFGLTSQ